MKTPTSRAPHICRKVLANTPGITVAHFGRTAMVAKITIRNQDTMIEVPAIPGAHMKATDPFLWLIDEMKVAVSLNAVYFGSPDHGPVHRATTTIRMMNGANPSHMSRREACGVAAPLGVRLRSRRTSTPP